MQKNQSFFSVIVLFLFLSGIVFFLSSRHMLFGESFVENLLFPAQGIFYGLVQFPGKFFQNNQLATLQEENLQLRQKLVGLQQLQADNTALRDQFAITNPQSAKLIPTRILSEPQFFPGLSSPENIIINVGKTDGVQVGDTVVYKNIALGEIGKITDHAALVILLSNKASSFTVKTSSTGAQGVVVGQGNGGMILGNVVLSDTLKVGDTVVTSGSQDILGHGYPPDLIVGKITSVSKDPSSLYQSANVASVLHIEKLSTVFVMKGNQ